jgi:hypothetical protein
MPDAMPGAMPQALPRHRPMMATAKARSDGANQAMNAKLRKPRDFAAVVQEAMPEAMPDALRHGCHSESESESEYFHEEERYEGMNSEGKKVIYQNSRTGRLVRFLFAPPRLAPIPPAWVATELAGVTVFNRFAARLAKAPPDLVTHLGMVRSSAYYLAGCPLELCDHDAARDLWRGIHQEAIAFEPAVTPHAIRQMEGLCR